VVELILDCGLRAFVASQAMPPAAPPKGRAAAAPDYISPDGAEIRLILRPDVEGVRYHSVSEAVMKPGQISRPMRHRRVEESWYVLEGEGEVWRCPPGVPPASVSTVHMGPGDALVIPPGFGFQVRAGVGGPLRMLCSTAPPWPGPEEAVPVEGGLGVPTQ
jgi:mannose-6-phosphate isomerase-like protein (cupin superfamily)